MWVTHPLFPAGVSTGATTSATRTENIRPLGASAPEPAACSRDLTLGREKCRHLGDAGQWGTNTNRYCVGIDDITSRLAGLQFGPNPGVPNLLWDPAGVAPGKIPTFSCHLSVRPGDAGLTTAPVVVNRCCGAAPSRTTASSMFAINWQIRRSPKAVISQGQFLTHPADIARVCDAPDLLATCIGWPDPARFLAHFSTRCSSSPFRPT
jgi:hypothetical protein